MGHHVTFLFCFWSCMEVIHILVDYYMPDLVNRRCLLKLPNRLSSDEHMSCLISCLINKFLQELLWCRLMDVCYVVLFAIVGNALLVESDKNSKFSDLSTWKATFDKVVSRHYPNFLGRYSILRH